MSFTEDDVEIKHTQIYKHAHGDVAPQVCDLRTWNVEAEGSGLGCTAGSRPEGDEGEVLPHLPTSESVSPLQLSCYFQFTGREAEAQDLKDFPGSTWDLQS